MNIDPYCKKFTKSKSKSFCHICNKESRFHEPCVCKSYRGENVLYASMTCIALPAGDKISCKGCPFPQNGLQEEARRSVVQLSKIWKTLIPWLVIFVSCGRQIICEKDNSDVIPNRAKLCDKPIHDECKLHYKW